MEIKCGIYKITNVINGKIYIGQSINILNRWIQHRCSNDNMPIHRAMRKYGVDNFILEILEECDRTELDEREIYWIGYYDGYNDINCYNATRGGEGASHPIKLSDSEVLEIIEYLKQDVPIKEISKYYNVSDKTISDINCGRSRIQPNQVYPIRANPYSKQKEYDKQFSESGKEIQKYHSQEILQCDKDTHEIIKEYPSIREAARQLNCNPNSIAKALKSKTHISCNYFWMKK